MVSGPTQKRKGKWGRELMVGVRTKDPDEPFDPATITIFDSRSFPSAIPSAFAGELTKLLNKYSVDNALNTPDFILANHVVRCLMVYKATKEENDHWHGRKD
jgi:hypothetical protein